MTVQHLCPELEADERVKEPSLITATVLVQLLRSELDSEAQLFCFGRAVVVVQAVPVHDGPPC